MNSRALIRRALPYLVIGIGGFALAYIVIFVFVLPSKIVPPPRPRYDPDTVTRLRPIDTANLAEAEPAASPPAVTVPMAGPPTRSNLPIEAPDVVGMAVSDARAVLNGYRLVAQLRRDTSSVQPANTVLAQSPAPGTTLQPGAAVTLTVSYVPAERPADSTRDSSSSTSAAVPHRDSSARRSTRRPLPPIIPTDADTSRPLPG